MSRFLLVPDLWFAPAIWQPLVGRLQEKHEVVLADVFPGDGLDAWIERVSAALEDSRPETWVVHGTAAALVNIVLDNVSESPSRLVLVAGLGVAGERPTMLDELLEDNPANAIRGRIEDHGQQRHLAASVMVEAFYSDIEQDVMNTVGAVSVDAAMFTTPLGALPAGGALHYIECVEDQYVHIAGQRRFRDALGITLTNTLQTGHLPMLTAPEALAACIARVGIRDSRYNR